MQVNNIGDTFQEGNLTANNKFMEQAVLDYYAALWHAKWPHSSKDLESYWGFTLTMGSTEGNLDDGDWSVEVPSKDGGAINTDDLTSLVEFFAIMVCFNYGTTFKGAYDDVALACENYGLLDRQVSWKDEDGTIKTDTRTGYWFHVDGALGAAYMPYIEMAYHGELVDKKGPIFTSAYPWCTPYP
ncbi:hypothetical protein L7F22_044398 [Adiantum nelumboides]|nr:hypothetical protein [Adiantum nelumboides]